MDPCDGCAADCCRGFEIVISGWDAYRITRDLGVPAESFVDVQGAAAPDVNYQFVLDGAAPRHDYHRLALKRIADERGRRCGFFRSVDGVGRCGIYQSRPDACRAYPATLDEDDRLQLVKLEFCPPNVWSRIDEPRYRARYRTGQHQRLIHDVICDGWNERVLIRRETRSAAELLGYLVESYAALVARKPAWFTDEPVEPDEREARAVIERLLVETGWR